MEFFCENMDQLTKFLGPVATLWRHVVLTWQGVFFWECLAYLIYLDALGASAVS